MDFLERLSDAELLTRTAREPKAFAAFYRRHERLLLRYLMARCRDPELTATWRRRPSPPPSKRPTASTRPAPRVAPAPCHGC
jgi:hypothetical protein